MPSVAPVGAGRDRIIILVLDGAGYHTLPLAVPDGIFGAVCPERGVGAGLVLPRANTEAMILHLAEIAATVAPSAHAVLVLDGAGWHHGDDLVVPPNLTLLKLPPYAPELNSAENIWEYLRKNKLANRLYGDYHLPLRLLPRRQ